MRILAGALAACLAACAAENAGSSGGGEISHAPAAEGGVIVAIRPLTGPGTADGVRGKILAAVGGEIEGGGGSDAAEFIVREDGGRTISVVQSNDGSLRPGERVVLTGGARMRIARGAD